MDNKEINRTLGHIDSFQGVYGFEIFKLLRAKNGIFVVNSEVYPKSGHWIVFIYLKDKIYYFDFCFQSQKILKQPHF